MELRLVAGIAIFAVLALQGCASFSDNDAVKFTNLSGVALEAMDTSLAHAIESSGDEVPKELVDANTSLQSAREGHQLLHLGTEIWLASGDSEFWYEQAPCFLARIKNLLDSFESAKLKSFPIRDALTVLFAAVGERACVE